MGGARYPDGMRAVRYGVALVAWLAAGYVSLWSAANTAVGPIVAVLSPTHGIHEGDLVVLLAGATVASMITVAVLWLPRAPAGSGPQPARGEVGPRPQRP